MLCLPGEQEREDHDPPETTVEQQGSDEGECGKMQSKSGGGPSNGEDSDFEEEEEEEIGLANKAVLEIVGIA